MTVQNKKAETDFSYSDFFVQRHRLKNMPSPHFYKLFNLFLVHFPFMVFTDCHVDLARVSQFVLLYTKILWTSVINDTVIGIMLFYPE